VLATRLPTPTASPKPIWEAVSETESARREPFLICGADGAVVGDVGGVHIGCQGGDERVEDVGAKGHQGREAGVGVWEGDVEAEDCCCIGAWVTC
jgi:hypothetical protein